jgi:hypothetical protein
LPHISALRSFDVRDDRFKGDAARLSREAPTCTALAAIPLEAW